MEVHEEPQENVPYDVRILITFLISIIIYVYVFACVWLFFRVSRGKVRKFITN